MFFSLLLTAIPNDGSMPPSCTEVIDISTKDSYEIDLSAGEKYCFSVQNSLFVNGSPVNLYGYEGSAKKAGGTGNIIITKRNHFAVNPIILVESPVDQKVVLFGSIFVSSKELYIATDNNVEKINVLKNTKEDFKYRTEMILLGPKTSINIKTKTDIFIEGSIIGSDMEDMSLDANTKKTYELGSQTYVKIDASTGFDNNKCEIEVESHGTQWVTPLNGFLSVGEWFVHSADDLKVPNFESGLTDTIVIIISVFSVIFVAVVIFFITRCKCFRKHHSSSSSSSSSSSTKKRRISQAESLPQNNKEVNYDNQPMYPAQPTMNDQAVYQQQQQLMNNQAVYQQQQMMNDQAVYQQQMMNGQVVYQQQPMMNGQVAYQQQPVYQMQNPYQ